MPVNDVEKLRPRDLAKEKAEAEDKENRLRQQMEEMSKEERRRIERETKKQKKIEADLEPERLLQQEMDLIRRKVSPQSDSVYLERLRGYVVVEGKEEE
jgi:hypothetical protein